MARTLLTPLPLEDRVVPAGTGLTGQYYDTATFGTLKLTRTDAKLDFNWGTGSPDATVAADTFSVRWVGELEPRFSEVYTITANSDEGVNVWVGDRLVIGRDRASAASTAIQGAIALTAGVRVPIRVEYIEQTGSAAFRLAWQSTSQGREIIPTSALYPGSALDDRGSIRQETWTGVGTIAALTTLVNYPAKPANRDYLVSLESLVQDTGDAIARRVSGRIVPSITGEYTFHAAGNDAVELWLSTDINEVNAVKIAFTSGGTAFRDWNASATQTSAPIALVAGNQYFIRVLHADASGADHFSIGWTRPGDTAVSVITGDVLIPAGFASAQPSQAAVLNTLSTAHPYLFTTPERFQRVAELVTNGQPLTWWTSYIANADALLTAAVNYYHLPDGQRLLSISQSVLGRVKTLGLAYQVTGNTAYAERAWLELEAAADFPDWNPSHFLDVAEMTHGFAIGYDWLYDYLTPARRTVVRNAIINFGLNTAITQYNNSAPWTKSTNNNWNLVCNGGIIAGALAIAAENATQSADIVTRALNSLRPMMAHFTADNGGWYEGPSYWSYATTYLVQFLSALETSLGSDFGVARTPGFDRTGMVPLQLVGPTKNTFNFADGNPNDLRGSHLFWLARRFNETVYAGYQRSKITNPDALDLIRYDARGLTPDLMGTPAGEAFLGPNNTTAYSPMEVVTLRQNWTTDASWIGFKGAGEIGDSHGHLDAGSFVFDARGERWAHDLGGDSYGLPNYFGGDRWNYYRLRAEGQNTLVINPGTGPDQVVDAAAPIILYSNEPTSDRTMSVANLTAAYSGTTKVWRGVQLFNNREELLVQDEITATTAVNGWWFMHVKLNLSQIVIAPDGKSAMLTQNGERLYVKIVAGNGTLTVRDPIPLPSSPYPAGQNANAGYRKLAIQLANVTNERLAVWMVPLAAGEAVPTVNPAIVPLNEWGASRNDAPQSIAVATAEDTPKTIDLTTTISDSETPASRLKYALTGATNGTAQLQPDGKTVIFMPATNYSGAGSVMLNVSDEYADSRLLAAYDFEAPDATDATAVVDSSGDDNAGTVSTAGSGNFAYSTNVPTALADRSLRSFDIIEAGAASARIRRIMPNFDFNTQNWTFTTWFNRRDTATDDFLFYLGDSDGYGAPNELQLHAPAASNTLVLSHYTALTTQDITLTANNILPNTWYHVAISFNTAGTAKLYVNGTLIGTDTAYTLDMNTTQGFILGGHGTTVAANTPRWFDGRIDDAALFGSTLPDADIAKLAVGTVSALGGKTVNVTIPVTINAVNDTPQASSGTGRTTWRNQVMDIDLRTIATDVETATGELLFAITGATNGTAVLLADGVTARFTPAANYTGPATFTFTANDTVLPASAQALYTFEAPDTAADGASTDTTPFDRTATLDVLGTGTATDDAGGPAALARFGLNSLKLTNPSDGNAARLTAPLSMNALNFNTASWSATGWFNRATSTNDDVIFYVGNSDMYGAHELFLTGRSGSTDVRLQHDAGGTGTDVQLTKSGLALNAWSHFAITFTATGGGAGTISFYSNGTLVGSDSTFDFNMPTDSTIAFGGHASSTFATYRWFNGKLDELAIHNTALTVAEVSRLATRSTQHAFGNTSAPITVNVTVTAPPTVATPVVNAGAAQRSRVTTLDLTFSTAFDASILAQPGAITLTRTSGGTSVSLQTGATGAAGRITVAPVTSTFNSYRLTFDNADGSAISAAVENGSLADGRWRVSIPALGYLSALNDANLRRLFGDGNGDGTVDGNDFTLFGNAFNTASIPFDHNADSTIDGTDLNEFGNRFGVTL